MDDQTIQSLEKQIQAFIEEKRPPIEIREKVDLGYSFENNSLELFEIRPLWDGDNEKIRSPIAKTRYIKSRRLWKVYWIRASGKWQIYDPNPEVEELSQFFEIVKQDKYGCFWG